MCIRDRDTVVARQNVEQLVQVTGKDRLAGLLDLVAEGDVGPDDRVAVLFTGVER